MNFLESISSSVGLVPSTPRIEKSFFPIVADKYITLHTENHQSKQWDHVHHFIDLIRPYLKKEGIQIVELGWNETPVNNVDFSFKNIDPKHAAYILSRSMAHVGVENFLTQLAGFYDVPCTSLYSNTSIDFSPPLWGDVDKQRKLCIESSRKSQKPSFAGEEHPKTINLISPEQVACKFLDSLGISNDISKRIPFFMGALSHSTCLEVVPDFNPDPSFFPRSLLNLRLDYLFNTEHFTSFASNRKISIISNKPVDLGLLSQIKPAIEAFCFKVDETFDIEYLKQVQKFAIPLNVFYQSSNPESSISATRAKFFDFKVEEDIKKTKKDLDNLDELCNNGFFTSSKMLFSKNTQYSTKASWEKGISTHQDEKIIDCDTFWEEIDHLKLYNIHDK